MNRKQAKKHIKQVKKQVVTNYQNKALKALKDIEDPSIKKFMLANHHVDWLHNEVKASSNLNNKKRRLLRLAIKQDDQDDMWASLVAPYP
jgi:translation initiation factor 2 beta subunit (eIF-2beta)/eIF-5